MIILKELKALLEAEASVADQATGGVHLFKVPQDAQQPNATLMLISGGEEYTHSGPDGLQEALIRIYSRGATPAGAITTGEAIRNYLREFKGTTGTLNVQGCFHLNTNGDHTDDFSVFRQIDDFRFHYSGN